MRYGNSIEHFEDTDVFVERMKNCEYRHIECTNHAFFRLSEKQRLIFTCDQIKTLLKENVPLKVAVQVNGNYAVFYKHQNQRIIRIVVNLQLNKIRVVTFYIMEEKQVPRG